MYARADARRDRPCRGRRTPDRLRAGGGGTTADPPARVLGRRPRDVVAPTRRTVRRVHGRGLGRPGRRPVGGSTRAVRAGGHADCLAGFVEALELARPHVAGLSFGGGLALELYRRHPGLPRSLVLASAYAGWAGSLPPDVVEGRLRQALELADLPPERFVREVIPTLFSKSAPAEMVDRSRPTRPGFIRPGSEQCRFSIAEADLREVLPGIDVPTLLIYGEDDVRAPLDVADKLRTAIPTSRLWCCPASVT